MPKIPSEEPNQVAPIPPAARIDATPTPATTGTTDFGFLGWFIAGAEGCTVRFGIEQQVYLLALTLSNYNALFSLLLACWLNRCKVSLTYDPGLLDLDPNAPLRIVSITALPPSSSGE